MFGRVKRSNRRSVKFVDELCAGVLQASSQGQVRVWSSGPSVEIVITQSPPGPKGPLALYVHTQETVDHTLLRVAVCSPTVGSRLSVHVRRSVRKRKSNYRVAYTLYAGLMPQRQAITILIIYCSKPQQNDAVTPTPLLHRSHTCMRALALGHDRNTMLAGTRACTCSNLTGIVMVTIRGHPWGSTCTGQ